MSDRNVMNSLPRSAPELQGVPSAALLALFEEMRRLPSAEIHSVMVLRHGHVIGEFWQEPFRPEYKHTVYSCSKTFTALAVGIAVGKGLLDVSDRVVQYLSGYLPAPVGALSEVNSRLVRMTVEDLLTMRSGIVSDWELRNRSCEWLRDYLALPVKNRPGEVFDYDSMCTFLLSAIVQKVTGQRLLDFLRVELFRPMGIVDVDWEQSLDGFNTGGWGLRIRTEDLAKVGQLFLNKGQWEGRQLVDAAWLEEMAAPHVETKYDAYGYQMWACAESPGACRMDGVLGQYLLIYPREDMVVAITEILVSGGWRHRVLLQELLFPELSDRPSVPGEDCRRLQERLRDFILPLPQGRASSPLSLSRLYGWNHPVEENPLGWESITLVPMSCRPGLRFTARHHDGTLIVLEFGYENWLLHESIACPPYSISALGRCDGLKRPFRVAGAYAWSAPDTLVLQAHWVDWVSGLRLTIKLGGEETSGLQLTIEENYTTPHRTTVLGVRV